MKIKIIADGHSEKDRKNGLWGLSLLVGDDVLFDTFCGGKKLLEAMKRKGIDPAKIKHVVISHRHWDHTGGLWNFLEYNNRAAVYLCGHSPVRLVNKIKKYGAKVRLAGEKPLKIRPGAVLTGEVKGYYKSGVMYEQGLIAESGKGSILICGCAHPGPEKMLKKALEGRRKIRAIAGGFHLSDADDKKIADVIGYFRSVGIAFAFPMHCSGRPAVKIKRFFNDPGKAGVEIS
ncbi:MAG: MBL fold metallo-hydrolase [Candidatus Goldiibacteriota bacterium]